MRLTLAEEYLLLATDGESGRVYTPTLPFGLAACIASDLLCRSNSPADPILRDASDLIAGDRLPVHVIRVIAALHGLERRVAAGLIAKGLMRDVAHRALGIFPYHRHVVTARTAQHEIRNRVRAAVFAKQSVDACTQSLAAVALATGLDLVLLSSDEIDRLRGRIREMIAADAVASAAAKVIEDENAAAVAAVSLMTASG